LETAEMVNELTVGGQTQRTHDVVRCEENLTN
jgi:hypothetical protein